MGGGKSGGGQVEAPKPITTTTSVGNALSAAPQTFNEEDSLKDKVSTKKLGTRGLRIPLTTDKTKADNSAASSGVLI